MFNRFVEVGRVAMVTYGPYSGQWVCIVDIIDQSRALVDNPLLSIPRHPLSYRRMHLTDILIEKVPRGIGSAALKSKLVKSKFVEDKWSGCVWDRKEGKRVTRSAMSDFDRFKVKLAKQARRKVLSSVSGGGSKK